MRLSSINLPPLRRDLGWRVGFPAIVAAAVAFGATGALAELTDAQQARMDALLQEQSAETLLPAFRAFWKTERGGMTEDARGAVEAAIGEKCKSLLGDLSDIKTLSSQDIAQLVSLAKPALSAEEERLLRTQVESAFPTGQGQSFGDLATRISVLDALAPAGFHAREELRQDVSEWVESQDLDATPLDQLLWCQRNLAPTVKGDSGFQVSWTGAITAPRDGEYTFGTCEWRPCSERHEVNEWSMRVEIGGVPAFNADSSSGTWPARSDKINLKGGEPVPIEVSFRYVRTGGFRMCPALLFWDGPGIQSSVVPAPAFRHGADGALGLRAEYQWTVTGEDGTARAVVASTVDPNIEFVWHRGVSVGSRSDALAKIGSALAARWQSPEGDMIGDLARMPNLVSHLDCSQLESCVRHVQETGQFRQYSDTRFWNFWAAARCGAGDSGVDLLGLRMQGVPDEEPQMTRSTEAFYQTNRKKYRRYAVYLGHENPALLELFEDHLEGEGGECVLPIAYICAYAYLQEGRIEEWISRLDQELLDESRVGSERVNWLLARAMAEEIRWEPATPERRWHERPVAGVKWLEEAAELADTPDARDRARREIACRYVARGDWSGAERAIEDAADQAELSQSIARIRAEVELKARDRERATAQAYLDSLRHRRGEIAGGGSQERLERLDTLISQAESRLAAEFAD